MKLGSDRPLYVITNVSRVTTPVSYYVKKKAASQMVSSDTRQELVTRDRIDYVVEMVPLLTADNLKSLPAGGNLRCNVNGGRYAVFPPLRRPFAMDPHDHGICRQRQHLRRYVFPS